MRVLSSLRTPATAVIAALGIYEGGIAVAGARLLVGGNFPMANLDGVDYPGALAALPMIGGTPPTPPAPAPSVAASAPPNVAVTAGDARLTVTWDVPANPGTFPVTNYRVTAQPGGATCVTSERACTLTALTNGREYAITVEALSGAGWGAPSAPVYGTPGRAAIQISGTREGRKILISGSSARLGTGAILAPWVRFAGQSSFREGAARILVDTAGAFTWQRTTKKRVRVYVATIDGSLRSNAVTIPAT